MATIKINDFNAPEPTVFIPTILDIDDASVSVRMLDGTLNREVIATKRQIQVEWSYLKWADMSALLQAMSPKFFNMTYPDPMTGQYETKVFYVGNRPAPILVISNGDIYWQGLKVNFTER